MTILKKPQTNKEKVEKLLKMLEKCPADTLGVCLAIESVVEDMHKQVVDKKFDALVDLFVEFEDTTKKQFELVKSIKILLDIEELSN